MGIRENDELCTLTDSLTGTIRWRLKDYEDMLKAELAMLVAMEDGLQRYDGRRYTRLPRPALTPRPVPHL